LYQAIYEQLELIVQRKLMPALGDSVEAARPRLAENWRSSRALRNVAANLIAIRDAVESADGSGFAVLLSGKNGGSDVVSRLTEKLEAAIVLAEDMQNQPIDQLFVDVETRAALVDLVGHVDTVKRIWADQVGPALDLNLGFNSLDGD
jgi:hypothetical protein